MIYRCKSNAKINIELRLVGVKNGFHLLNSVFVPIDLCDDLEFSKSDDIEIIGFDFPTKDNIIYKTIMFIKEKYKVNKGVKVVCNKNIPMMAGLGGGSSNAAFTIKALNELWHLKLSVDERLEIAKEIGSDVSFFVVNVPSYVTGFGEKIEPIELEPLNGILIFNGHYFNTKKIYQKFDSLNLELSKDYPKYSGKVNYINDMEKAIIDEDGYDNVIASINDLKEGGASQALMSGSGSSTFGLFDNLEKLDETYELLKDKYKFVYKFKSV